VHHCQVLPSFDGCSGQTAVAWQPGVTQKLAKPSTASASYVAYVPWQLKSQWQSAKAPSGRICIPFAIMSNVQKRRSWIGMLKVQARAQASSILPHPKRDLKMRHMNAESRKTYLKASKSLNHFSTETHGDMEIPHFEKCQYNAAIPWASSISPDCHQLWSSSQSLECCPALSFECAHRKPTDILAKFCGAPFDNETWLWEMLNLYVRNKEKSSIDRVFSNTG